MSLPFVIFGIAEAIVNKYKKSVLSLFNWLMEPWPLHIFPALLSAHLLTLKLFPANSLKINSFSSTLFQLSGGLMILWVLSLNLGIITKSSLFESFSEYLKRFPFIRRSVVLSVANVNVGWNISPAELKVNPALKSLEEKVNFLQKEIGRLENEIIKSKKETKEAIRKTEEKLRAEISSIKSQIEETNSKIKTIFSGGAKWEILGALNVSYGLIIPLVY